MSNDLNTIVAVGALSFAMGIFVSLLCWDRPGVEGEIEIKCPPGISRANLMLVGWSAGGSRVAQELACDDHTGKPLQLANFAEQVSNDITGARIKP